MQLLGQSQMRALQSKSAAKSSSAACCRISPAVPVHFSSQQQQQQVLPHTGRLPALRALDTDKYGGNEKVLDVSQLLQQVSAIWQDCADATADYDFSHITLISSSATQIQPARLQQRSSLQLQSGQRTKPLQEASLHCACFYALLMLQLHI